MISARNKTVTVTQNGQVQSFEAARDPLEELEKIMGSYRIAPTENLPGFYGGAVGYLGYDCVRWFEPTVAPPRNDDLGIPDMFFLVTGTVVIFDHRRRRLKIVANAFIDSAGWAAAYDEASREIEAILHKLARPIAFVPISRRASRPAARPRATRRARNTTRW